MKTITCTRSLLIPAVIAMAMVFSPVQINAQKKKNKEEEKTEGVDSKLLSGLKWRGIGPALTSGRVADFAVNPENHSEWYVAIASGNVWKTVNNGTTFKPVFDAYDSYSTSELTKTETEQLEILQEEFPPLLDQMKQIVQEISELDQQLEELKAPWTPGRVPELN